MALHTHFNHANEISWMTELASRKLVEAGVTIRNQTVLLRGVNDNVAAMSKLIRTLADDLRITPVRGGPAVLGSSCAEPCLLTGWRASIMCTSATW